MLEEIFLAHSRYTINICGTYFSVYLIYIVIKYLIKKYIYFIKKLKYSSLALPMGGKFQDPQWMYKTADSTKPYIYYDFLPIHICLIKFNLQIRQFHR